MRPRNSILTALLASLALAASASAATLLSTDFQSHATAAATETSLNAVTTGGTWTLPGSNVAFTMEEDGTGSVGDKGLLLDTTTHPINTDPPQLLGAVSLSTSADFSINAVTFNTSTAPRRTGSSRNMIYELIGTDGISANLVAATIYWTDSDDTLTFNGSGGGLQDWLVISPAWDADSDRLLDFSAVFSGSNATIDFGGLSSGSLSVQNGVTSFTGLRVYGDNPAVGGEATTRAQGVYLDDISVTQVPEPSTLLLVIGSGSLLLLRRRKD